MPEPYVRPDVAEFLRYLNAVPGPKVQDLAPDEARKLSRAMTPVADLEIGPLARVQDVSVPRPDGGDIPVRLFDAKAERAPGPVMVFFHGGGWVVGDLDGYAPVCAEIARALDMPVLSIGYRLAPEHPWPAGTDDAETATRWIASAPDALGLHPTGLVLAGDSAGGTLTLTTAIALRDEPAALPVIAHWAIYPAADLVNHYPSYAEFSSGYMLTREMLGWFAGHYQPDVRQWRGSPMLADLTGLPPAVVTTASLDPIRDQGRAYAAGLARAGVSVRFIEAKGNIHGFLNLRRAIPSSKADLATSLAALKALIAEETLA